MNCQSANSRLPSTVRARAAEDLDRPAPRDAVALHFLKVPARVAPDNFAPERLRVDVVRDFADFPHAGKLVEEIRRHTFADALPPVFAYDEELVHPDVIRAGRDIALAGPHPREPGPVAVHADEERIPASLRPVSEEVVAGVRPPLGYVLSGHLAEIVAVQFEQMPQERAVFWGRRNDFDVHPSFSDFGVESGRWEVECDFPPVTFHFPLATPPSSQTR